MNRFSQKTALSFALTFSIVLSSACSDVMHSIPTTDPTHLRPSETRIALGTSQSADIDSVARAFAVALSNKDNRLRLLNDLRDSPFPQHRIHLSAYLRGKHAGAISSAVAKQLNSSERALGERLGHTPELELIVPRSYDRVFWQGSDDLLVVGVQDLQASYAAPLRAFDVQGGEHTVEMWRGILDRPILMVYPVTYEFGDNPDQLRATAAKRSGNTISRVEEEIHPSFFEASRRPALDGSNSVDDVSITFCDPDLVIIPCDPDPGSGGGTNWGGYWLPDWVTWDQCIWFPLDRDGDGFDDECAFQLASQFAPLLATHPWDIVTREPSWAAGPIPSENRIVIFYALSYHFDLGCRTSLCGPFQGATAHNGDSEWIVLLVEPVSRTSPRWRVVRATLSAHWNAGAPWDQSRVVERSDLFWADNYAGRPLIWVADGKHANYKSKASCDDKLHDTCSGNRPESLPLQLARHRHLGLSWGNRLQDCVYSSGFGPQPGQECYWTADRFQGWQASGPDAGGYKHALAFFGF